MSKYEPLGTFLARTGEDRIPLTFKEIEGLLGTSLPPSAYAHSAWWSNTGGSHVQARAWMERGFRTEDVDLAGERLTFVREESSAAPSPGWNPEWPPMKDGHHPAYGSMKGMITVMPGVDLTQPVDPEWVESLYGNGPIGGLDD